jgi:hypothetical protein
VSACQQMKSAHLCELDHYDSNGAIAYTLDIYEYEYDMNLNMDMNMVQKYASR